MKKNSAFKRLVLHTLQHIAAIGIAVMIGIIAVNSNIVVDNMYGDQIGYRVRLMDNVGEFRDSRIFTDVFRNAINDITRLAVIKGQLETEGRFDGAKVIDATMFVNRVSHKSDCDVTAGYQLDELIRWGKYGLELQTVTFQSKFDFIAYFGYENIFSSFGYGEELEQLGIPDGSISDIIAWDMKNEQSAPDQEHLLKDGDAPVTDFEFMEQREVYETARKYVEKFWGIDELFERITAEMTVLGKEVTVLERGGQEIISTEMLVPRYDTVTDQSIAAICSNWPEYCMLESNVIETVETLAYNYILYQNQNDLYAQGKTNLYFFISTTTQGGQEYYTNMEESVSALTDDERTDYFRDLGKYVVYYPDAMRLETNANITEDEMFDNVSDYEYAFPQNTKLWIGVNADFPIQYDQFYLAQVTYDSIIPHIWLILILCGVFALIWAVFAGYISYTTGKEDREGEPPVHKLYLFDRLPTEIVTALLLAAGMGLWVLYKIIYGNIYDSIFYRTNRATVQQLAAAKQYVLVMIGGFGLLVSLTFCLFWYSLVRRLQCANIWKNSIIYYIGRGVTGGMNRMLEHPNAVIRTFMPYNIFLLANLLCVLAMYELREAPHQFILLPLLLIVILDGGVGIYVFRRSAERSEIINGISKIREGDIGYVLDSRHMRGDNRELAVSVNNMGDGIRKAVATSMKDERMQADLITNVSHDIKTPLTSIINYVNLLKREKITQEPVSGYIEVLDAKAQRLKQLTDDLLEASKISSGNIILENSRLDLTELVRQSVGEFSEKLDAKKLQVLVTEPSGPAYIYADSRRMWRVVENLFNNICKYAMEGTRVYVDLEKVEEEIVLSLKNISETSLNFSPDELTERFVRGDVSRSSEGSGLGLSIAKNLTELQGGEFKIILDGDLFKVLMRFKEYGDQEMPAEQEDK